MNSRKESLSLSKVETVLNPIRPDCHHLTQ